MADPAPTRRRAPVGYRFRPTEEELVTHYLHHKLMADEPSIYNTIPEIDVCKHEPWDLLARGASAFPEIDPDDSECYFFSPRDYKYRNSTRRNRTTSLGYWKVTGRGKIIKDRDTNKVIGMMKNLVFYKGRFPHGIKQNWVIHEYHDRIISSDQRTHVLCRLKKKHEKKTKEKIIDYDHELIHDEEECNNHINFEYENQANILKESYPSNMDAMDTMVLISSPSNEVLDSITQISFQPNETINSNNEIFDHSNRIINSSIETSYHLNEDSIQTLSQSNKITDSTIQIFSQTNNVVLPELNSTIDTSFDFDSEEFYNSLLLQLVPTIDEQGLW